MNTGKKRIFAVIGICAALMVPMNTAFGESEDFKKLSAEWWQWVLSIPASQNPLLDETGGNCVIGQHGSIWFLAGNFGGTTERSCAVPEGTILFSPVLNSINIDTPNVCGQGPERIPIEDLRAFSAAFIDPATNLSVELDGRQVEHVRRVQSKVFPIALPAENLFAFCAPAGIYSPAVDDGFYTLIGPLSVGDHTLRIQAENPSAGFALDVTYHLTVVPVVLK